MRTSSSFSSRFCRRMSRKVRSEAPGIEMPLPGLLPTTKTNPAWNADRRASCGPHRPFHRGFAEECRARSDLKLPELKCPFRGCSLPLKRIRRGMQIGAHHADLIVLFIEVLQKNVAQGPI